MNGTYRSDIYSRIFKAILMTGWNLADGKDYSCCSASPWLTEESYAEYEEHFEEGKELLNKLLPEGFKLKYELIRYDEPVCKITDCDIPIVGEFRLEIIWAGKEDKVDVIYMASHPMYKDISYTDRSSKTND